MCKNYIFYFGGCGKKHKRRPITLEFSLFNQEKKLYLKGRFIMTTFKEGQAATFELSPLDSKGRPAKIDGVPVYENSNPAACDLFVNADGLTGTITWLDGGTAQIKATVDADLGEGVRPLIALADIECLAPEAVTVAINVGTPTP
jgi:hypothetical protein